MGVNGVTTWTVRRGTCVFQASLLFTLTRAEVAFQQRKPRL
jgi:hypothetical protein